MEYFQIIKYTPPAWSRCIEDGQYLSTVSFVDPNTSMLSEYCPEEKFSSAKLADHNVSILLLNYLVGGALNAEDLQTRIKEKVDTIRQEHKRQNTNKPLPTKKRTNLKGKRTTQQQNMTATNNNQPDPNHPQSDSLNQPDTSQTQNPHQLEPQPQPQSQSQNQPQSLSQSPNEHQQLPIEGANIVGGKRKREEGSIEDSSTTPFSSNEDGTPDSKKPRV
eukprot:TRINITY_DN9112_c0_g1_i1.p1 TRINITY_DN9112_c0_g1~~TRINITY_DN9112_c0_g1_i1.p1  ORF type:complete len:219 (-),score=42.18 TRINITY_DN9112_c0_g1_i1:71-727(-)